MEQEQRPAGFPEAGPESQPTAARVAATTEANEPSADRLADAAPSPNNIAFCPGCFYDLRGTQRDTCPECGQALDLEQLRGGLIPWAQRREIGRLRGFFRTAWRATFRPRQLCYAVAQPVSYRDARRFQIAAVLWAVLGVAVIYAAALACVWMVGTWIEWQAIMIPAGVLLLAVPLLLAVTGVHTYWLHPRHLSVEQQNRAIALGYYAAGPLAFVPFAALIAAGAWVVAFIGLEMYGIRAEELLIILVIVAWGPLLAIPVTMLRVMLVMARYAAGRETLGLSIMGISLPLLWLALTAIILGLIPALMGYVWLMIDSLLT